MSRLYPVFANIEGRKVVVVGGGPVAQRKVSSLLKCRACVVVISPELTGEMAQLRDRGLIEVLNRPYQKGDIEGAWLVIAATGDELVNQQVFDEANEKGIFCNVVDVPDLCSFQVPSVVRRGDLQIAISTSGASPALAKHIRKQLQEEFGKHYEPFLTALSELRTGLKNKYPNNQPRRAAIMEEFVNSSAIDLLRHGKLDEFEHLLDDWKDR